MFLLRVAKYFEKKYNLFSYADKDLSGLNIENLLGLLSNLLRDVEKIDLNDDILRKADKEFRVTKSVSLETVKSIENLYNKYKLIGNAIAEIESSEIPEINKFWHRTFNHASSANNTGKAKLLTIEENIEKIADNLNLLLSSIKENNLNSFKKIFEESFSDSRPRKLVIDQASSIINQFIKNETMTHSDFDSWVNDTSADIHSNTAEVNTEDGADSDSDEESDDDDHDPYKSKLTLNHNGSPFVTIFFPHKNTKKSFLQEFPQDPPMSAELSDFFEKNKKERKKIVSDIDSLSRKPKKMMEDYIKSVAAEYGLKYDDLNNYASLKVRDIKSGGVNLSVLRQREGYEMEWISRDLSDAESIKNVVNRCISEINKYVDKWQVANKAAVKNNTSFMNVMRLINAFSKNIDNSRSGLVSMGLVYKYLYKILSKTILTLKDREKVISKDFAQGFADKLYSIEGILHKDCKHIAGHYLMDHIGEARVVNTSMARGVVVFHDPETIKYRKDGELLSEGIKDLSGAPKKVKKDLSEAPEKVKVDSLILSNVDTKDQARVFHLGNQQRHNKSREQVKKDSKGKDFEPDQDLSTIENEMAKYDVPPEELERYGHIKHPAQMTLTNYISKLLIKGQKHLALAKNALHTKLTQQLQIALQPYVKEAGPITRSEQKELFLNGMPRGRTYTPGSYGFELAREMKGYNQILAEVCSETKAIISSEQEKMNSNKRYVETDWDLVLPEVNDRMEKMYSKLTNLAEERSMMRDDLAWIKKKQQLENSDNKDGKDQ